MFQRTVENSRQERDWLTPTHVEERNDTQQESWLPSTPLPSRFSDWSSLGSPHARTISHSVPDRGVEPNVNIPNPLSVQSGTVPRHEAPEEVVIPPPSNQQVGEQSVHVTEMEPNLLSIEVRMQRDDMGTDRENNIPINLVSDNGMPSLSVGDLTPSPNVSTELENNSDIPRGSHVRTQDINLQEISSIPPMEGLTTNKGGGILSDNMCTDQHHPHEGILPQRTST